MLSYLHTCSFLRKALNLWFNFVSLKYFYFGIYYNFKVTIGVCVKLLSAGTA